MNSRVELGVFFDVAKTPPRGLDLYNPPLHLLCLLVHLSYTMLACTKHGTHSPWECVMRQMNVPPSIAIQALDRQSSHNFVA